MLNRLLLLMLLMLLNCPGYAFATAETSSGWQKIELKGNENIRSVFKQSSLPISELNHLINQTEHGLQLVSAQKGDFVFVKKKSAGEWREIRYVKSTGDIFTFTRGNQGYQSKLNGARPSRSGDYSIEGGVIKGSLFASGRQLGISKSVMRRFAEIFDGEVDFVRETRDGDSFSILVDYETNEIIAAEFVNQGKIHRAFKYVFDNGQYGYFSEKGKNLEDGFLCAPLDYTRVSSGFNNKRTHPILKVKTPHRGVDYVAPTGTPVFASNIGRVIESGFSKPNGNYIFIEHSGGVVTKYLHLSKRDVRKGDVVKRRQLIGRVGKTGFATGPHLHYELIVEGKHVDPITASKKAGWRSKLTASHMASFRKEIAPLASVFLKKKDLGQVALKE